VSDDLSSGSLKNLKGIEKDVEFHRADLRYEYDCNIMTKGKDAVFGFAADMGGIFTISKYQSRIIFNNTKINLNMLSFIKQNEVPIYFNASSACAYNVLLQAEAKNIALKESDAYPALPNEPYGWEKLYTEQLCQSLQRDYGINIRIARFHNVYSGVFTAFDKERGKAPCHLILKAIKHPNPPFTIWGTGEATRSFLYVDDCIEAVLLLMDSDFDQPINIGSDRCVTVNEFADLIIKISGKKIEPLHDLTMPVGVMGRNSDNTLIKKVLNWEPKISLEEGLKRTYDWAIENYNELEGI
jgi:nucleoside-diphosphate-sugar epimerase